MLLSQRIKEVLTLDPGADAIIVEGHVQTWKYLTAFVEGLERALAPMEAKRGASVGLIVRNRPPHLAAVAACLATESCLVTLSPMYSDADLVTDIESLGLHAVVGDLSDLERRGVMDAALASGAAVIEICEEPRVPIRIIRGLNARSIFRRREGLAIEMLSSGTTGTPKRIALSYEKLEAALGLTGSPTDDSPAGEVQLKASPALVWHPLVHISGVHFTVEAICSGRPIILLERFDPTTWSNFVEAYRVRVAHVNPAAMKMILDAQIDPLRLKSLRALRSGTAGTPPELQLAFENRFGVPVLTTYGATEFAGAVASWTLEDHDHFGRTKVGSSGRAHPGVELRTVDAFSGAVSGAGEQGVLEVRALQAIGGDSSWTRTTDLAVIDGDGFLWIQGRTDDVIIRGGFKVHPGRIVEVIKEHPSVFDAVVVGLTDDRLGAVPVAAVTLRESAPTTSDVELLNFLRARLTAYEVPRAIRIVDELPLTPSMKVSRPKLLEMFK